MAAPLLTRFKVGVPFFEVLIDTENSLSRAIEACGDLVGVDTEFIRTRTFFPIPALYQLAGLDCVSLVDAQADHRFESLKRMLSDPKRMKVMHACSEDLEVIDHHLNTQSVNLVDTQLAHAFLSPHFSLSYQGLVEKYCGIKLPKQQTRSNWLRRPLTDEQIAYAEKDALYLARLWLAIKDRLVGMERLSWFKEEMTHVLGQTADEPHEYYRGMKRAWRMSAQQLAILRGLSNWRELEARRRDVPRGRTVPDEFLIAIAEAPTVTRNFLVGLLPKPVALRYAKSLMEIYERSIEEDELPPVLPPALTQREGRVVKEMRELGRSCATKLGIAPELLARKREVEACVRCYLDTQELPDTMLGWRLPFVGHPFMDMMRERLA